MGSKDLHGIGAEVLNRKAAGAAQHLQAAQRQLALLRQRDSVAPAGPGGGSLGRGQACGHVWAGI